MLFNKSKRKGFGADKDAFGFKTFEVEKMPLEPFFRYIPDRQIMQRLIMRAAEMKDDLAELNLEDEEAVTEAPTATVTENNESMLRKD